MPHSYAKENARLRRELAALRRFGATRTQALHDFMHARKGSDVASAATITLPDIFTNVTGTTTITAISEHPWGIPRVVRFTGILTLTHNATSLILPTAANITTAANDVAEFFSLADGNWLCTRYTLASGVVLGVVPIPKGGTGQITAVAGKDALTVQSTNIAAGATVDLSTATGELVIVTGSGETISALGTVSAGAMRELVFSGANTLSHNAATLDLPTDANITTADGDRAVFRSYGSGNWICTKYTKADGQVLTTVTIPLGGTSNVTAVAAKDALTVASSNIAAGSTIDLATATGEMVTITGSGATVTSFGTVSAGALRTLRWSAANTLTHNATSLILPTAANITTAANDTMDLRSLGSGNWICTQYKLADGTILTTLPITKGGTSNVTAGAAKDALTVSGGNVASGATTNIGAAAGEYVTITGTTTITAFDTVAAGIKRYCTFADALTLTHNATSLILPGAANITTAANDVALMRSLGSGNWRCEAYTLADGTVIKTVPIAKGGTAAITAVAAIDNLSVKGADIASGSTTDLSAATGDYVDVTGTTTINALGTAAAGVERTVRFTGAGTITHNATSLILPTGANITRAAGDKAIFRSRGSGNWECISYTLADGTPIPVIPITKGGSGQITAIAAIDAFHTAGSDIASGATVNLDSADGHNVTITGSTTITAFTLANGKIRRCRFSGAPKITYNATSLKTPGQADIQGVAGDKFDVHGLGSGNVEIRNYDRVEVLPLSSQKVTTACVRLGTGSGLHQDATAITDIIAWPYLGNTMPVYDGVEWRAYSFGLSSNLTIRLTVTMTGTTVSGSPIITGLSTLSNGETRELIKDMEVTGTGIAASSVIATVDSATQITMNNNATANGTVTITFKIPASKNVDIFAVLVSGAIELRLGNIWTNATTRAIAVSADLSSGIYTNYDATLNSTNYNSIPADQGTYLGTVRTTATAGQTESSVTKRFIWNYYNRFPMVLNVTDTTDSWTYTTATWRQVRATSTNQVDVCIGILEGVVFVEAFHLVSNTSSVNTATGIGVDATNANSALTYGGSASAGGGNTPCSARYIGRPGVGYHYFAWLEISQAAGTSTWKGDNGLTYIQTGLSGYVMA